MVGDDIVVVVLAAIVVGRVTSFSTFPSLSIFRAAAAISAWLFTAISARFDVLACPAQHLRSPFNFADQATKGRRGVLATQAPPELLLKVLQLHNEHLVDDVGFVISYRTP